MVQDTKKRITSKTVRCRLPILMASQRPPINQTRLADAIGLSRATINRLYHNQCDRVDFETMAILCEYFDCEIGDLFVYKK